ncbi:MAG: hypothetical protein P1V35_06020, partial [Planctomycetota bacterium]|nr:hypothetical protein [Planctomycetota bacterium]
DRLHNMESDKRKSTLERAKVLREIMEEIYGKMDTATKARVDALEPAKRSRLLGQLAIEEARSRSREARLVLEGGPQGSDANPSEEKVSRKDRKAIHEKFLKDGRRRLGEHVKKNGLPKGFTQEKWDRFLKLDDRRFGHDLRRLGHKHPELLKVMGPPPGRRTMDPDMWELHKAMRLPPREHMKLVDSEGRPSRKEEAKRRRARVMKVLHRQKKHSEERLGQVEAMSDTEFKEWMHTQLGPRHGPEGRRPGRGSGRRPGGPGGPHPGPPGAGPPGEPGMGPPPGDRPPRDRGGRPPRGVRDGESPRGPGVSPHPDKDRKARKPRRPRKD